MQNYFNKVENHIVKNIEEGLVDEYFFLAEEKIQSLESYIDKFIAKGDQPKYIYKGYLSGIVETDYIANISSLKAKELKLLQKEVRLLKNSYRLKIKPNIITSLELINIFYGVNFNKFKLELWKQQQISNLYLADGMTHNMESIMSREVGKRIYGNLLDSIRIYNRMGVEIIIRINVILNEHNLGSAFETAR